MFSTIQAFFISIQWIIAAFVVGILVGGAGGYKLKSVFVDAANSKVVSSVLKQDTKSVVEAQKSGEVLETKKEKIGTDTAAVVANITKLVPQTKKQKVFGGVTTQPIKPQSPSTDKSQTEVINDEKPNAETNVGNPDVSNPDVIATGVVGLLNYQLDPTSPNPAQWSDEQKQTPSNIGLLELSTLLAQVAGQCRSEAQNHDSLVDSVLAYQAKIAKSRN